jgi:hypothetical protein
MFTTSFGTVERALLNAYGVPEKARGSFRGRMTNLQRQGLFGPQNMPGRGKTLVYTPDMVHRLIFACEMFEFGVSPAEVLDLVDKLWDKRLSNIFNEAERTLVHREPGLDDVITHMGGVHMLADGWANTVPNVNWCPLRELPRYIRMWMETKPDDSANLPPRAMIVNLSARLRTFHHAFADSHMRALVAGQEASAAIGTGSRRPDRRTAGRPGRKVRRGK